MVIAAKARQVLDYNAVDLPTAYILHHALKIRSVEVGTGASIVAVDCHQPQVGLTLNVCQDQVFLPLNRI